MLAFALHASDELEFGRGISTDDEPDLWRKSLTGDIELWVELGTPEPERLKKACGRAREVVLYCYGDRATPVWWEKHVAALGRLDRLSVFQVSDDVCAQLAALAPKMHMEHEAEEGNHDGPTGILARHSVTDVRDQQRDPGLESAVYRD